MALQPNRLFSPAGMQRVDQDTIARGITGPDLMDRAGRAIARLCLSVKGRGSVRILCGPGNNGGDGWVAARYLKMHGWAVELWSVVDRTALTGDAALAASQWNERVHLLDDLPSSLERHDIVIDALFGVGLDRPLSAAVARALQKAFHASDISIAVDMPSGIDGGTGADLCDLYTAEAACVFDHCITFGAPKFGHVLLPGKTAFKTLWLADIGLCEDALCAHSSGTINHALAVDDHPGLSPKPFHHKYQRGHIGVFAGGAEKAGAGMIAAQAALLVGAGLVTLLHRGEINARHNDASTMHAFWPKPSDLAAFLERKKITSLALGPGLGLDDDAKALVDAALALTCPMVLDADALTIIAQENWLSRLKSSMVLTPHEGEFSRLFGKCDAPKLERLKEAIADTDALICFKGSDTLIGARRFDNVCINTNAPANLAVAGSGDMLAGLIAGLMTPQTAALTSVRVGVHLHGLCGQNARHPTSTEGLLGALPAAIDEYRAANEHAR